MSQPLSRRRALGLGAATLLVGVVSRPAAAADYTSAAEALDAIEGFEVEVARHFLRLRRTVPAARVMIDSFRRDHERHRRHRERVRRRLGLALSAAAAASEAAASPLDAVREAQAALVYAHAEGLPAVGDQVSVGLLLGDLVDLARHLTVIDLWIEAEAARG